MVSINYLLDYCIFFIFQLNNVFQKNILDILRVRCESDGKRVSAVDEYAKELCAKKRSGR